MLALPAIAAAQPPPPPPPPPAPPHLEPGWYHNGAPGAICENNCPPDNLNGLRIDWENSYVYQHPVGSDPLYWYAQVVYRNIGSNTLTLHCRGGDPTQAKEHMSGTLNSGSVPAEETYCSRNPNLTFSIEPGGAYNGWAIFHNVPWKGGEVSLEWGDKGSSPWVDPWQSPYSLGEIPPPGECPSELVTLGTCVPVSVWNEGSPKAPGKTPTSNLVVLVHGCCTDANGLDQWLWRGRLIAQSIQQPSTWEIVVWDWTKYTPPVTPDEFFGRY